MVKNEPGSIALIEFHDATLSEVNIRPSGALSLAFSTMNVFEQVALERFDIWVYRMFLDVEAVENLQYTGTWPADAVVAEFAVDGEEPELHGFEVCTEGAQHHFQVSLFSGASIRWTGTRAFLRPGARIRYLESWNGPLKTV